MAEEWTLSGAGDRARDYLRGLGLPQQTKPTGMGKEYSFPTNVAQLSSAQLGNLRLQLTAWMSWLLQELGDEESQLAAFETVYEIRKGQSMHEEKTRREGLSRDSGGNKGVIVKEVALALAIANDPTLKAMTYSLIERRLRISKLKAQFRIYDTQLDALSGEQARRNQEVRHV